MKILKKLKPIGKTTKKEKKMSNPIYYKDELIKDLKNLDYAAGYLTAALEEGEDVFLLAIRDVAQANGGMSILAKDTKLNRENLYYMLSKEGNPRLSSITTILNNLGIEVKFAKKAA